MFYHLVFQTELGTISNLYFWKPNLKDQLRVRELLKFKSRTKPQSFGLLIFFSQHKADLLL